MQVFFLFVTLVVAIQPAVLNAGGVFINTDSVRGVVTVKSWKEMRDDRIVKQDLDYSCGAASLATVLREYYGMEITEEEVLDAMGKEDGLASFQDLATVARSHGFLAQGIALSFAKLKTLKIPAIAYLRHQRDDHFTVIRGIDSEGHVWLGDSLWGNRHFTEYQFRAMWETREDEELKGKILLVLPAPGKTDFKIPEDTFFTRLMPLRNRLSEQLVEIQVFR